MIKKIGIVTVTSLAFFGIISAQTVNPLEGKIIALDAGHGGDYDGGYNIAYEVVEKDVNLAVVYELKTQLEQAGAKVVLTRVCNKTILSRKERAAIAEEKCLGIGGECDILLSVHHNGSIDPEHNGILVIYNEKQDVALANALHNRLVNITSNDEGYLHGGYGITIFDHFISALTEAYYITNDEEAETYLKGTLTNICTQEDGSNYQVRVGFRITEEVDALYLGLVDYFSISQKVYGKR